MKRYAMFEANWQIMQFAAVIHTQLNQNVINDLGVAVQGTKKLHTDQECSHVRRCYFPGRWHFVKEIEDEWVMQTRYPSWN